jgi:hypothetical protein
MAWGRPAGLDLDLSNLSKWAISDNFPLRESLWTTVCENDSFAQVAQVAATTAAILVWVWPGLVRPTR